MSLRKKMVLVSMGLFFLILTIFTLLALSISNVSVFKHEQKTVRETARLIQMNISEINAPLTQDNLTDYLQSNQVLDPIRQHTILTEGADFANSHSILHFLYANQTACLYNADKNLIFTTNLDENYQKLGPLNKLVTGSKNGQKGFVLNVPIYNKNKTAIIGYAKVFHSLEFYYNLKNKMILLLIGLEVITILVVLLIMYYSIGSFLKPIHSLHKLMRYIAQNPKDLHMRSDVHSGDEIEELSNIFNKMLDRIAEQNDLQQRFISDVSHELRTPVAIIMGHLDMLSRWGKNDPEILQESLEASRHEAHRMNLMINDMLESIGLKNQLSTSKEKTCSLETVIKMVVNNFKMVRPDFDYQLYIEKEPILAAISSQHFEQLLTILVDNATKYSSDHKIIQLSLTLSLDYAILIVKDYGIGIEKEDLNHIFERFYRTDKSRNRDIGSATGLGIGLSILNDLVTAYHCQLEVESEIHVGTKFIIKIPLVNKNEKI